MPEPEERDSRDRTMRVGLTHSTSADEIFRLQSPHTAAGLWPSDALPAPAAQAEATEPISRSMDRVRAHEHPMPLGLAGLSLIVRRLGTRQVGIIRCRGSLPMCCKRPRSIQGRSPEAVGRAPVSPSGARAKPVEEEGAWPSTGRTFPSHAQCESIAGNYATDGYSSTYYFSCLVAEHSLAGLLGARPEPPQVST